MVKRMGLDYAILADVDGEVVKRYGVLHPGGAMDGSDIASPAHVLIDRSGRIAWRYKARLIQVRPDPADILSAIAALN